MALPGPLLITRAIQSLRPGAAFGVIGENYGTLVWHDETQSKPTRAAVFKEMDRLKALDEAGTTEDGA